MNDRSTIGDIQAAAVVEEYRKARVDGATAKAEAILAANPDLAAQFNVIDKTCA